MGMAASQARFLGLTARKTNVEFEGQQINQQRTTLSNQSANYYNDLLGMSVPVPPSVDDYTKTVYTFEDGALTNQITAMIAQNDGTYTVSYLRQWTDDFSVVGASTSIVNRNTNNTDDPDDDIYMVGSTVLRTLAEDVEKQYILNGITLEEVGEGQFTDGMAYTQYTYTNNGVVQNYYLQENDDGTKTWFTDNPDQDSDVDVVEVTDKDAIPKFSYAGNDEYLSSLTESQIDNLLKEEQEYIELLNQKYGVGDYLVRYVKNSTTEEYEPYFYKLTDLENAIYDTNTGNSQSNINCYTIGSETKTEEVKAAEGCRIEKDSSGRYINITIPQYDDEGNPIKDTGVTYSLTTSTATDQDAYEDAMNQYEYEKYEYDQAIQEINAKIEIVQAQDKNLELRLKQLDTEQDAISTEMDAVQKVIEKNTESTFKTFG